MSTEKTTFEGAFGDRLAARLERPDGEPLATAVFAHCFTCSKDLRAARAITRTLAERGYAVLRFDFTGLGESGGDFADTHFSSNVDDLVAAADHLRREIAAPRLLVGHSLGGAAVLVAASRIPEVEAVATIGAPSGGKHLQERLLKAAPELEDGDEAEVELAGRTFRIRRELIDDLAGASVTEAAEGLGRPLLILHSPVDDTVPIEHAGRLFEAARHPKSCVALDGADHLLTEEADARFAADVLGVWAERYVAEERARTRGPGEPVEAGRVVVRGGREPYRVTAGSDDHVWIADEPDSVGGGNAGPDPYELLLSSLGACKAITVRMYADRKGWPLHETRIRLAHSRVHAEDCEECATGEGKVDRIDVDVDVRGPLSDGQREKLLEISGKCPVHRTLEGEIEIVSRGAGEDA